MPKGREEEESKEIESEVSLRGKISGLIEWSLTHGLGSLGV